MPRRSVPDPLAQAVGRRIRELRDEAGLTMEKLAFESELKSKGHLSNLERGLARPTIHTLHVIAERLGVLVADLVNEPQAGDRARLLELSRHVPIGVLRKLVRELEQAQRAPKPKRAPAPKRRSGS